MFFFSLKKSIILARLVCLIFSFFILIPTHYANSGPHYTKFNRPVVDIFNDITKFLLSIIGGIALLIIIIASVYYITSAGSSERQEKAKKVIIYCLFGVIIILVSYGVLAVIERIAV